MRRRDFLRFGAAAAGAPALLPILGEVQLPELGAHRARDDGILKLSSNENPLGIPPAARRAMTQAFSDANRYPGGPNDALAEALAAQHGVPAESIVLGSGSTDVLRMAVQSVTAKRASVRVVLPDPTFEDVFRYSDPFPSVELVRIPLLEERWAHDLDRMAREADEDPDGALVYICNPNNPTGSLTPVSEVRAWIEEAPRHFFLVDEAYFEFVDADDYESLVQWSQERPNVFVARTFSKVYGMAGVRVGYGIGAPATAARVREFATPTNPNLLGAFGARAALDDRDHLRKSIEMNARSRELVYEVLDELGLEAMPSHTNFVMHRIRGDLARYQARMEAEGILVGRAFPPYTRWNRLSLGTPEQMARWAETIRGFRGKGWI